MSAAKEVRGAIRSTAVAFWLVALFLVLIESLTVVERYEARLAPVVTDFRITSVEPMEGGVRIAGEMVKARDCRFLGVTMYAGDSTDLGAPRERLRFSFADNGGDADRSREPGLQTWGPWHVRSPLTNAGPELFMRVSHKCNPLYETRGVYYVTRLETVFPEL